MHRGQKTWITITIWIIVIGFAFGGVLFFTPGGPQGLFSSVDPNDNQSETAIVVNGEKIPKSELDFAYQSTLQRYTQLYQQFGGDFQEQLQGASGAHRQLQLLNEAANSLIRKTLLQQEARERGISVSQTQVDRQFSERYDQFLQANGITEERLKGLLRDPNVRERFRQFFGLEQGTLSEFKSKLRSEVAWELKRDRLQEEIVGQIEPTVKELLDYAEENKDQYLSRVVAPVTPSEEELQAFFEENKEKYRSGGETPAFEEVKPQVRTDYINEARNDKFRQWIEAARQQGEFPRAEEVHARHILIKVPNDAPEQEAHSARARIEQIRKRLEEGAQFSQLAQEFSEDPESADKGGDLGWIRRGEMVPEFETAAFSLDVGQISDPVRTQFGFHLIKLEDRRMSEQLEQQVRQAYVQERTDRRFNDWVAEIEEKAEIEVNDPLLAAFRLEERARQADQTDTKLERLEQATAAYHRAGQQVSSDLYAYIGYFQSRLYREQIESLQGLLDGQSQGDGERSEEEKQSLQERIQGARENAADAFLDSAGSYGQRDDTEFQKVVKAVPNDAELRYGYARFLYEEMDNRSRAYNQLTEALKIDPQFWEAHLLAAELQEEASEHAAAIEHLRSAADAVAEGSQEEGEIRRRLAEAYLKQARQSAPESEERAEALAQARGILTNLRDRTGSPEQQADVLALLGDVYMAEKRYDEAQEAYNSSLDARNRLEVEVKLGRAYLANDETGRAQETFESAIARQGGQYSAEAHLGLGDVYREQGELEEALDTYHDALDLRTDNPTKIEIARRIVALDPGDTDTRFKLASLYEKEGQPSKSVEQYQEILESEPESWRAERGLGRAYSSLSAYEKAVEHFQTALDMDPPTDQKIQIHQRILEAERSLAGGPDAKLGENGQRALLELAELYVQQGRGEKAKEQLQTLKTEYPEFHPEQVAELEREIEGAGKPGRSVEIQSAQHVKTGETHPAYNTTPPTSGWHLSSEAEWGVHQEPIPDELQVHNLEHGGVLIQYQPQQVNVETVEQLSSFVTGLREQPKYCKLIAAPYPDMEKPFALTAWGRILELDSFDQERIVGFIEAFIDQGREKTPCE